MTDDDFLIEEVADGMSASSEEEEDLLADVGGSSLDRLHSWELDSQISQPPTSLPPQPAYNSTPLPADPAAGWDGTTEPVPPNVAQAAAAAALGPGRGAPVLVVDPRAGQADSPVEAVLIRLGFKPRLSLTGASTRDELSSGRYKLVFLRLDNDPTWARMLVTTAAQRWPQLRFVASLPAAAHDHMAALKTAGVADIVPDPLPDDARLLVMLQRTSNTPAPAPSPAMTSRLATPVIPTPVAAPRPPAASEPPSSDVTRLRAELVAAQRRAQDLEAQLALARADKARAPAANAAPDVSGEFKSIITHHPYGPALDQALKAMTAAVDAGQPLAHDELVRHAKNLKAVRAAWKKLEERLGVTKADYRR
jgi:hypothetical protein